MAGQSSSKTGESEDYWIGVDWGTTNCAVAIYSRSLGRTKWMRLGQGTTLSASEEERRQWEQSYQLTEQQKNGKVGRIMPSVLVLASTTKLPIFKGNGCFSNDNSLVKLLQLRNDNSNACYPWYNVSDLLLQKPVKGCQQLWACVGAAAERFISAVLLEGDIRESNEGSKVFAATVRSVKRLVLKELAFRTTKSVEPITNTIHETTKSISVSVMPLGCNEMFDLDAGTIAAIFLRAIRFASDDYLRRPKVREKLGLSPHSPDTGQSRHHCCLGVPATASLAYRSFLQEAAQRAGFLSSTCITESTAAAIAYGLFTRDRLVVSDPTEKDGEASPLMKQTIVVFDMGGGTTDITIAEREIVRQKRSSIVHPTEEAENMDFHVCVTVGNDQLGGDDMDQAILRLVGTKLKQTPIKDITVDSNQLLLRCRAAKLLLCGSEDSEVATTVPICVLGTVVSVSLDEFLVAIEPILDTTRKLIHSALERYQEKRGRMDTKIDEVILIGGASRVPAIRELLRNIFIDQPCKLQAEKDSRGGLSELCTSVNAMSAVAQGCAVSAALISGTVPFHELKSSYMLDTTPYSIGVLLNPGTQKSGFVDGDDTLENSSSSSFVEILPQGASLPAAGYATFVLADVQQAGISLIAAEQIDDPSATDAKQRRYNVLGEFTFLLHRLSKAELARMKIRSVDVGMTLKENGEFVVSIFDQNDPDHIRKKEWYQKVKRAEKTGSATALLDLSNELPSSSAPLSWEQVSLMLSCVVLLVLYVAAKITFSDPESIGTVVE